MFGITTAVAVGGAIVAISSSGPRQTPPGHLVTLAIASSLRDVSAPATPETIALANHELHAYAFETYPSWVANNPDRACPRHLLELNHYAPILHAVDPWGSPYQLICGKQYGRVLSMRSAGPDRRFDTTDDLSTAP